MPRPLLLLNAAFALVALMAVAYVVRELRAPTPGPDTARRGAAPSAPAATVVQPPTEMPAGGYQVVAARNLFSPTRSEAPATAIAAGPAAGKPSLYGVLVTDTVLVAYIEDPVTKRVGGYRLGDTVAGGKLTQIGGDFVVLNRPDGDLNVRLREPFKPRAAPPAAAATPGGAPPAPPTAQPGPPVAGAPMVPPAAAPPVQTFPAPSAEGVQPPPPPPPNVVGPPAGRFPALPRRPLPPSINRGPVQN